MHFLSVLKLKYLVMMVIYQNYIYLEVKGR